MTACLTSISDLVAYRTTVSLGDPSTGTAKIEIGRRSASA